MEAMTQAATQPSAEAAPVADNQGASQTAQPTGSFLKQSTEAIAKNDADWTASVPDKFKNENGINYEGIYKSYSELESKLGKYGLAPETPDNYEYNYEPSPDAMITLDPEVFTNLRQLSHTLGLSQKQFEPIAKGFDEFSKMVVAEAVKTAGLDPETQYKKTEQALNEVWKTPEAVQANLALAHKAFNVYANDLGISVDEIGNNPAAIRILAKIGASLGEDKGMIGDLPSQESYENLIYSPAFTNPHHKDHARVRQQVEAMEARGAKLKR